MNKFTLLLALMVIALASCRTPYDPDIDTDQQILVVDAFLSDQPSTSYVRLTMAIPYDSSGNNPPVQSATVFFTDQNHQVIHFQENQPGYYEPTEADFAGEVNGVYVLTVITTDGDSYESDPQTILPGMDPSRVYGGFDRIEYLSKDAFGKTIKVTEVVCATYFDYLGNTETPHFRYRSSQLVEYSLDKLVLFINCWRTETDNNLRFTNQKFASTSADIFKQEVCVSPPTSTLKVYDIIPNPENDIEKPWIISDSLIETYERKRILEIKQYRMNDESYNYYKDVQNQSDAKGKIFDPVISQLKGNISCISNPSKPVFGFFEASSLATFSYIMQRNSIAGSITFTLIENLPPHSSEGFLPVLFPDFWI